jgi:signal transduction histidine kinase
VSLFAERYPRFKQEGAVRDLDFELVRKDGTIFPVILNSTAVRDAQGNYLCSRTTLFDATERRRHEQALQQFNDELEQRVSDRTTELAAANADLLQKNEENEMFVYSVSHDLRSPLVNLQGFSQELATALPVLREIVSEGGLPSEHSSRGLKLIDDDMRQSIRFIQTAVSRLSGIIDALLRLSRAGRVEYQPQIVDTNRVVARIVESMSATIFDRGVAIDAKPLPECCGDSTAIEQVFANLIGNAVKYLDANRPGHVEIGALPPRAQAETVQQVITYYVKDNGLGIDPMFHPKVFQALKRLHPDVAEGEGIGLAIVKRIVERHGGTISFESAAGAGATFYVTLPKPATLTSDASAGLHEFSAVTDTADDERSIGIAFSGR